MNSQSIVGVDEITGSIGVDEVSAKCMGRSKLICLKPSLITA